MRIPIPPLQQIIRKELIKLKQITIKNQEHYKNNIVRGFTSTISLDFELFQGSLFVMLKYN